MVAKSGVVPEVELAFRGVSAGLVLEVGERDGRSGWVWCASTVAVPKGQPRVASVRSREVYVTWAGALVAGGVVMGVPQSELRRVEEVLRLSACTGAVSRSVQVVRRRMAGDVRIEVRW